LHPGFAPDLIARCPAAILQRDALFDLHYTAIVHFVFLLSPDFSRAAVEKICQGPFLNPIQHTQSPFLSSAFAESVTSQNQGFASCFSSPFRV
jgi:hypothetical protein